MHSKRFYLKAVRFRPDWAKAHSRKGLSLQGGRVCRASFAL